MNSWALILGLAFLFAGASAQAQSSYKTMDIGYGHGCAISELGVMTCWGLNLEGECDMPHSAEVNATAVAAGSGWTCALVNGQVQCWGDDYFHMRRDAPT